MKKTENTNEKKAYSKPEITKIAIDNQISMVMMSPPDDPYNSEKLQDSNNQDPYKTFRG